MTVADGHLDDAIAAHAKERGDEAVEPAIEHEIAQALAAERPERASAVPDGLLADGVPDPVGDPGRDPADPRIAGGSIRAPAGRGVPLIELGQQVRNIIGVVL